MDRASQFRERGTAAQRERRRLLRVCDVVLNQPREAAAFQVGDDGKVYVILNPPKDRTPKISLQADAFTGEPESPTLQEQIVTGLD